MSKEKALISNLRRERRRQMLTEPTPAILNRIDKPFEHVRRHRVPEARSIHEGFPLLNRIALSCQAFASASMAAVNRAGDMGNSRNRQPVAR